MRFSDLNGKRIALWGLGRETQLLAAQVQDRLPNATVTTVVLEDETPLGECGQPASKLPALAQARFVPASQAVQDLAGCDVLIRSPGVSIHKPELVALRERGLPITTATGLWVAERGGRRIIGVTGTKGKSTTATILHALLSATIDVELAGNIGRPALELLDTPKDEWVVLELSSYQIADLPVGPEVAVITNLYLEHFDWHGSHAAYRSEKLRLFSLPEVQAAVYEPGDPEVEQAVAHIANKLAFGVEGGWHVAENGDVVGPPAPNRTDSAPGERIVIPAASLPLRGPHNALNLCAALAAIEAAGLERPPLPAALERIKPLPHRLQSLGVIDGVEWVDDSISTTPESTLAALAAYPDRPLVVIAGGHERQQDYTELAAELVARQATLITLPITGTRLAENARAAGLPPERLRETEDMERAVTAARELSPPGAAVLLSPAAPSYNSYKNFEARGDHFATLARKIWVANA